MIDFGFYNMDCVEGMKQFPDKFFDLAIVDPPYGINASKMCMGKGKHKKFKQGKKWDEKTPDADYFNELFRVSKNQIIWGGNYFTEYLPPSKHWIVWDKVNPGLSFAEGELAWVRDGKLLRICKCYSVNADEGGKIHPTQKPIALYEYLLSNYAKDGFKILDTHVGSASSLIACHRRHLDFVGFELDPEYYAKAKERLEAEQAQLDMFDVFGFNPYQE